MTPDEIAAARKLLVLLAHREDFPPADRRMLYRTIERLCDEVERLQGEARLHTCKPPIGYIQCATVERAIGEFMKLANDWYNSQHIFKVIKHDD